MALSVRTFPLHQPALEQLLCALKSALDENFASVDVRVVPCPDLREAPWGMAAEGLGSEGALLDLGCAANLQEPIQGLTAVKRAGSQP